jgi:transposase-like protein
MYSKAFRALMVQKMTDPAGPGPEVLANEIGVSRASLYRWLKDAAIIAQRTIDPVELPTTISRPPKMKRPQDWSAKEKLAAVLEAASLSDEDLGAFLRSKGLHNAQLQQWREQMLAGLNPVTTARSKKAPEAKRVRELEKELRRKDAALAETAALLVLKKKAQMIWGDEDDNTDS